jgi:hypothetical protein
MILDAQQSVVAGAAFVIGAGAAWGAAQWWFGRQLRAAAAKQDKVDKAREFAAQQASQARKQIEALQKELGDLRHASRPQGPRVEVQAPPEVMLPVLGAEPKPGLPADGFADTQVLAPRKR